ncbi:MAG: hypothetical protein GY788_15560 [bacterium]|nr:hypothetical protein [bacterium]
MSEQDNAAAILTALAAQLSGVHMAARGHSVPFYPPPNRDDLQAEAERLGPDLAAALFSADVILVRCSEAAPDGIRRGIDHKVLTFHGRRLIVTATGRRSKLPHSGRRLPRYLVTDLEILMDEERRGVTISCHHCGQPHRITTDWLAKAKTHSITSIPASKQPYEKLYPDPEDAAFAEVLGPLDQGPAPAPTLLIGLTPARLARFRDLYKDEPNVLGMSRLYANDRTLILAAEDDPSHTSTIPGVPDESPGGPWEHSSVSPTDGSDLPPDGGVPPT